MIKNKVSCSYYATPLRNGELTHSDIAVGFIANTPTTFTLSIGNDFTLTKSLNAGDFQFAFYDNAYPLISTSLQKVSISNLNGSGYIIYANIDIELRRILARTPFSLGDYQFVYGIVKKSFFSRFESFIGLKRNVVVQQNPLYHGSL
jgi:hypothetical protein